LALAPRAPWLVKAMVAPIAKVAVTRPLRYLDILALCMAPADKPILARSAVRAMFAEDLHEAFRQGTHAFFEDLGLIARPWQLPLAAVRSEIAFWHGDDDRMIPVSASRHLASAISGATLHVCRGEGHFMVFERWPEILRWLVP
jgi:pimeloyl-ACP methyl ester carboxylesterase